MGNVTDMKSTKSNIILLAIVPIVLGLAACAMFGTGDGAKTPKDELTVATMALEVSATGAELAKAHFFHKKKYEGCVALGAIASVTRTASEATLAAALESPVIPSLEVDVSDCLTLRSGKLEGDKSVEEVAKLYKLYATPLVDYVGLMVNRLESAGKIKCRQAALGRAFITFVNQTVGPVLDELANPDGKLSIPQVPIDISKC